MRTPIIHLAKTDSFIIDNVHYEAVSHDREGYVLRTLGGSHINVVKPHAELAELYFAGRVRIVRGFLDDLSPSIKINLTRQMDEFSASQQKQALIRLEYVQTCDRFMGRKLIPRRPEGYARVAQIVYRYHRRKLRITDDPHSVQFIGRSFGGSTVRDWHWRWTKSGRHICALIPLDDLKGRPGSRIGPEVEQIVAHWIKQKWLTLEAPSLATVHDLIVNDIDKANELNVTTLTAPSLIAVRRWIGRTYSNYEITFFREGKTVAEQNFRHVRRAPQYSRPLQVVEIDHTPLNLSVLRNGALSAAAGKAPSTGVLWLTTAICAVTRMIVGWYLSFDPPSWTSVMACMRMGILPKDTSKWDVRTPHPVFGVWEILKIDNGKEFHATSLHAAAGQLRMELRWMSRKKPHLKGKIERVQGTIARDFLAFLPGKTFRDSRERGNYDSHRRARFEEAEVQKLFAMWVIDIYHNNPNAGLSHATPLQRWEDLRGFGVRLPPEAEELRAILALTINRTIRTTGVTFLGLIYNSRKLQTMHRRSGHLGKEYMVKVDPLDLTSLLVMDEKAGKWLSVPCEYPELATGIDLRTWKETVLLARRMTQERNRVPLQILREARRRLSDEASRKGMKPERMTQTEIDWFGEHYDDPVFDVGLQSERKASRTNDGVLVSVDQPGRRADVSASTNSVLPAPQSTAVQGEYHTRDSYSDETPEAFIDE